MASSARVIQLNLFAFAIGGRRNDSHGHLPLLIQPVAFVNESEFIQVQFLSVKLSGPAAIKSLVVGRNSVCRPDSVTDTVFYCL